MFKAVFWQKILATTSGGAMLIAFFSVISKLLGLYRDRLLASFFGAGPVLDSYYAAFKLPDLIFNTLVLGALASAFIPVFTRVWLENKDKAIRLSNTVLNYLILTLLILSVVCFVWAPLLVKVIVPGFIGEQLQNTIALTRIMLLSIVFFGISNILGGILNSLKKFLTFSLAPVFYNLGIITGIVFLYPAFGLNGLGWGVVLGAILHFLIQLPETIKNGWQYQFSWKITASVRRIFILMLPRTLGLAGNQVNQLIITMVASTLMTGSIAVFNLANNLQSFPISIFGVSLAIAVFPVFSEALARNDLEGFKIAFSVHFRRVIFLVLPVSIFMLLLRAQIVRLILGSGNFDWQDTYYTAQTLGWFTISLFAQSLIPILARSFYALQDTKTPVLISLFAIILNIAGSIILGPRFGVIGLAIAFSVTSILNMILLMVVLRIRMGYLDDKKIVNSILKISLNSFLSGAVIYLALRVLAEIVNMQTFVGIFLQALFAGLAGILVYFVLSLVTRCEEIEVIGRKFRRES